MPYHFEFDSINRVLRGRVAGRVTDGDLTDFYRSAAEHVALVDPIAGIVDLSAVTSFEVSPQTIRRLAKSEPAMPEPSRLRVIVAISSHVFGMARMFEFEGEATRPNLHVVRTVDEAWAILGIHEPRFEPMPALSQSNSQETSSTSTSGDD
jgi:hypothetical protein